jgi:hypothetical protein
MFIEVYDSITVLLFFASLLRFAIRIRLEYPQDHGADSMTMTEPRIMDVIIATLNGFCTVFFKKRIAQASLVMRPKSPFF